MSFLFRTGRSAALIAAALSAGAGVARAEEERRLSLTSAEVLADASDQPSVLTSKYENFTLKIGGAIQFRYIAEVVDDEANDTLESSYNGGFEITRTRIDFGGQAGDPSQTYFINTAINGSGTTSVLDLFFRKSFEYDAGKAHVKVGQFKLPIWYEWAVSERQLQFVERSLLDARFSSIYSQGIELGWLDASKKFRTLVTFSDGLRSANDANLGTQWAFSARADLMLQGTHSEADAYNDFTAFRNENASFRIGASGHYQDGGTLAGRAANNSAAASRFVNDTQITQWSVDAQWQNAGWNLFAAGIGNHTRFGPRSVTSGSTTTSFASGTSDEYGLLIQGGYFVTDDVELIARYEYGNLDNGFGVNTAVNDELNVITGGVNYFLISNSHALKWTTDIGYSPDEVNSGWGGGGSTGKGYTGDPTSADFHIVARTQLQVLF